jgi:hypothetical protein
MVGILSEIGEMPGVVDFNHLCFRKKLQEIGGRISLVELLLFQQVQ